MSDDFFLPAVKLAEILEHAEDELSTADKLFLTNVTTSDLMYLIRRFNVEKFESEDETIESFINNYKNKGEQNG